MDINLIEKKINELIIERDIKRNDEKKLTNGIKELKRKITEIRKSENKVVSKKDFDTVNNRYKKEKKQRERFRILAVFLLKEQGFTYEKIGKIIGLESESVSRIIKNHFSYSIRCGRYLERFDDPSVEQLYDPFEDEYYDKKDEIK